MKNYKITVLKGDGIGPEIVDECVKVLDKAGEKFGFSFDYNYQLLGGCAIDEYGVPYPDETAKACKASDAVLLGAVGGPKWDSQPGNNRPEKGLLAIREDLGLFANLRPAKIFAPLKSASPIKEEIIGDGLDILIVRELTGGIYFGDRCESEIHNGAERAWDLENYSVPEVDRITRFAMEAARKRHGHVTSVDKSNVLATSRLWRRTVIKIHDEDYPDVQLDHMYVDNCAQQFAIHPSFFDVVVTGNLFGDILSDEAAVLSGSIGMLPSASIGNETSLYEPIHGSAPDIAGKGIANPIATILSAAMLLRYSLNEDKAADAIEAAVNQALDDGYRTGDIYKEGMKKVNGRGMTDAILARIQ